MAATTYFAENKLLDALLRGQALGAPATWTVALYTVSPTRVAGTGTKVVGGAYADVAFGANLANWYSTQGTTGVASSGTTGISSNAALITFPAPTANWGTIVAAGLIDAGANLWFFDALAPAWTVSAGDPAPTFQLTAFSFAILGHV